MSARGLKVAGEERGVSERVLKVAGEERGVSARGLKVEGEERGVCKGIKGGGRGEGCLQGD